MSSPRRVVSDAGPLISLEKLTGGFNLIRQLFDIIIVPQVVLDELAQGQHDNPQAYVHHFAIEDLIEIRAVAVETALLESQRLHEGEKQAIQLAVEFGLPLLIEEKIGRRLAEAAGLKISGIAGQIVRAHREGILSQETAAEKLGELLSGGRINIPLYEALMESVGGA